MRPFVPGDRVRRVNWRATARRGELWVNETHPERNTDVVLFLDTFAEARAPAARARSTTRCARRPRSPSHYLRAARPRRARRVRRRAELAAAASGLVPALPDRRRRCSTPRSFLSYAWKDIDLLPPRTLPPQALVLALTPLLDERAVRALLDLRARGFDLAVVEISPVPFARARRAASSTSSRTGSGCCAGDALRSRYQRLGVPVAEWREGEPLAGRARGGEDIQAPRPGHARLAPAAGAVLVAARLALSPLVRRLQRPGPAARARRRRPARALSRARGSLERRARVRHRAARGRAGGPARDGPDALDAWTPLYAGGVPARGRARLVVAGAARARLGRARPALGGSSTVAVRLRGGSSWRRSS